jgi:ribosomal protein L10
MSTIFVQLHDLPQRQISALRRKTRRLGLSTESYLKTLIENDLEMDEFVRHASFAEIAAPFRKAYVGGSEEELDRLVDAARTRHYQRTRKRNR